MRLTEEQQKLVEENHSLIYFVLRKRNLPLDEFYDVAALGLCQAAANFDSTRGFQFSTYACSAINGEINHLFKRPLAKKRNGVTVSFDDPVYGSESATIGDFISCPGDVETHAIATEIQDHIRTMGYKQRRVVELSIYGSTQSEIAADLGESQTNICRRLKWAKQELSQFT